MTPLECVRLSQPVLTCLSIIFSPGSAEPAGHEPSVLPQIFANSGPATAPSSWLRRLSLYDLLSSLQLVSTSHFLGFVSNTFPRLLPVGPSRMMMKTKTKMEMYLTSPAPSETTNITYTPMLQPITSFIIFKLVSRNALLLLDDNHLRKSLPQSATQWLPTESTYKDHLPQNTYQRLILPEFILSSLSSY